MFIPKKAFLTKGAGFHKNELQSYELALRDAGIEKLNLVSVSSIFPPNCEIIRREEALNLLEPGKITFCVMARLHTNENRRMVGASIGIAFPSDRNNYGYISEYHAYGQDEVELGDFAEDL
ncbi:MAG: arginine decarboxylase, pyruvoyl-dependent, partial [Syntrophobacteraceae bacterium]